MSEVGAAPNPYAPDVVSGASVTQPSWLNDQASIRAGLEGEEKFPAPIRLQRPTPSVWSLVSYRSGNPKPCPVSCATVPIGMMSVPVHESEPPSPLWRT